MPELNLVTIVGLTIAVLSLIAVGSSHTYYTHDGQRETVPMVGVAVFALSLVIVSIASCHTTLSAAHAAQTIATPRPRWVKSGKIALPPCGHILDIYPTEDFKGNFNGNWTIICANGDFYESSYDVQQ